MGGDLGGELHAGGGNALNLKPLRERLDSPISDECFAAELGCTGKGGDEDSQSDT